MRFILVLMMVLSSLFALNGQNELSTWNRTNTLKTHEKDPDRYRITGTKLIGWGGIGLSSFVWYAKERYEFQGRRFFEIKFGSDPYGFWGSKSHIRVRNKFIKDDFYHVANTGGKFVLIGSSITLGIGGAKVNKKKIHYLYDFLIAGGISIFSSYAGDRIMDLTR